MRPVRCAALALMMASALAFLPQAVAQPRDYVRDDSVYVVTSPQSWYGFRPYAPSTGERRDSRGEALVLARVDASAVDALSRYVHEQENRCGGFFAFDSLEEAEAFVAGDRTAEAIERSFAESYTIDNHATVDPWLAEVDDANIHATITTLSAYLNRYYTSSYGKAAAEWIRDRWRTLAGSRGDVDVELFTGCTNCSTQPSVIMTVRGGDLADEVVVIGGHLDSINGSAGGSTQQTAPGADDDASGIATITEIARIALASGWKPRRTVKFMGYAAEEVGLRGSAAVAAQHLADGVNVVGVLQLDMTNYRNGAAYDMQRVTDYSNASLQVYVGQLFDAYLAPRGFVRTDLACNYGCSDHASWTAKGFPAAMMFEAGKPRNVNNPNDLGSFPYIHSTSDTLANMGNSAANSIKFAQFGLAFVGELGKTQAQDPIFEDGFDP